MTIKHKKASAAGASPDPAKVGGDDWNDDHVVDAGGITITASTTPPATPAVGTLQLYSRTQGGGTLPAYQTADGWGGSLQPSFGTKNVCYLVVTANTTSYASIGVSMGLTSNSTTARALGMTSLLASTRRLGINSVSTANSYTSMITSTTQYWRGNAPGLGGFRILCRWACADATSAAASVARTFVGLMPSTIPGTSSPGNQTNIFGVGTDSGDTSLSIFTNDGAGTPTKTPLGPDFPDHTLSADLYELMLYCAPNSNQMSLELTRLNTGHVARATLTTDLPSPSLWLSAGMWRCNASSATPVTLDICHFYAETDY